MNNPDILIKKVKYVIDKKEAIETNLILRSRICLVHIENVQRIKKELIKKNVGNKFTFVKLNK